MLKKNIIIKLCCIFYFLIPILGSSNITFKIDGLDSELKDNVYKQLSNIDLDVKNINLYFKEQLYNTIQSALKPLGYYDPSIEIVSDLSSMVDKNCHELIIKINPGKPIRIVEVNIHVFGDGAYDCDYQHIIKESKCFIGKKLHHNDYEQLKNKIYNLAISKGYLDAKFQKSQLIVIPSLYQSIWNINFDSGKRYLFEEIKFYGSQIKEDYLRNICNIHLGEYYHSKHILELNARLSSTNWFESILTSSEFIILNQKKN